jgi:hypothetical protein
VRIVDDEHRTELVAQRPDLRKSAEVAFHGEHAVGHHPQHAGHIRVGPRLRQDPTKIVHIGVLVHGLVDTLLDHGGKTHRIDDAGVVQRIGDDHVARIAERRKERLGCRPA